MLLFSAILTSYFTAGCTYRFTNRAVHRPEGIRTIAVEAIYDTSREVLPHEILWSKLQAAIIDDGHLRLAPQDQADALLRAHILEAVEYPSGTLVGDAERKDPVPLEDNSEPPLPSEFRRITRAETFRNNARLRIRVAVEVYNLRTRTRLLQRTYLREGEYRAFSPALDPKKSGGLLAGNADPLVFARFHEAREAEFTRLAESIAGAVVQDLLVP